MKAKLDLLKPRVGPGALLGLGWGIGFAVPVSFILWFIELVDTGREISNEKMISGVVSCGLFGAASGAAINYGAYTIKHSSANQKASVLLLGLWGIGFLNLTRKARELNKAQFFYEEEAKLFHEQEQSFIESEVFNIPAYIDLKRTERRLQARESALENELKKWNLQEYENGRIIENDGIINDSMNSSFGM